MDQLYSYKYLSIFLLLIDDVVVGYHYLMSRKDFDKYKAEVIQQVQEHELDEEHYDYIEEELWKDREFIECCLGHDHHIDLVFSHVDKSLWQDKEFVLWAIGRDKVALEYTDEKLKNDVDILEVVDYE